MILKLVTNFSLFCETTYNLDTRLKLTSLCACKNMHVKGDKLKASLHQFNCKFFEGAETFGPVES